MSSFAVTVLLLSPTRQSSSLSSSSESDADSAELRSRLESMSSPSEPSLSSPSCCPSGVGDRDPVGVGGTEEIGSVCLRISRDGLGCSREGLGWSSRLSEFGLVPATCGPRSTSSKLALHAGGER